MTKSLENSKKFKKFVKNSKKLQFEKGQKIEHIKIIGKFKKWKRKRFQKI